jgi:hypothetical protein
MQSQTRMGEGIQYISGNIIRPRDVEVIEGVKDRSRRWLSWNNLSCVHTTDRCARYEILPVAPCLTQARAEISIANWHRHAHEFKKGSCSLVK